MNGYVVIVLLFVAVLIIGLITLICHFIGDHGRYYGEEDITKVIYLKTPGKLTSHNPDEDNKSNGNDNCTCHQQFKGVCDECEGNKFFGKSQSFGETTYPTFNDFGGNDTAQDFTTEARIENLARTLSN